VDAFVIRTPIFGPLVRKGGVARFTGRSHHDQLRRSHPRRARGCREDGRQLGVRSDPLHQVEDRRGKTIVQPLSETKVFPPMVVQMIGVGRGHRPNDQMLSKIADFYDDKWTRGLALTTSSSR